MTEDPSRTPPPLPPYDPAAQPSVQDWPAAGEVARREQPGEESSPALSSDREQALARLQAKREFSTHLTIYWLVMTLLTVIWFLTTGWGNYFWPVWPMIGWGLGVAIHGATLLTDRDPTEAQIAAEEEKLRQRRQRRLEG